jgi:hypothetical protein
MLKRQARRDALENTHKEMSWIKAKVKELSEHTGLPDNDAQDTPTAKDFGKKDEPIRENDS